MPRSILRLMLLLALFSCPVLTSCASSSIAIQDSPGITITPMPVCLGESFILHIPIENSDDATFSGEVYTYLSPPGQGRQIWKDRISLSPGETKDHQVLVSRMQSRSEYVGEWEVVAEIKRSGASLSSSNIDSSTARFSINDCTNCKGKISGYVRDWETGKGLAGATLSCENSLCSDATSSNDGYYEFGGCLCPSTTYTIECYKEGYNQTNETVTTDERGSAAVYFRLEPEDGIVSRSEDSRDEESTGMGGLPPEIEWSKTFDTSDFDGGISVQQTSDRGYIIACCGNDVWLIKTDAVGNKEWDKNFGGAGGWGASVQQTSDGGFIVAGGTYYGAGYDDFWLTKTDSRGNEEWNKTFGGSNREWGESIQQTSDGGYIVTGMTQSYGAGGPDIWLIKTDSQGNKEWSQTFGGSRGDMGHSVQQTSDGGYIVTGYTQPYGDGSDDVWLIKTDSRGNEEWSQTFGGSDDDYGESVQQTSDGGYIITGGTDSYGDGSDDVWLIKTDSRGNEEWSQTFGGSSSDNGDSVQQTSDGGFIVTGQTWSYGAGHDDVWLIKTDSRGNEEWNKTFGGSDREWGESVQQTSDGGYIVTGYTQPYGNDDYDVWLIKLVPSGSALSIDVSLELLNDGREVIEGDWPKVLVTTNVESAAITLTASGGTFTETGTDTIAGVTNNASAFSTLWKAPLSVGEYTISAEVSKPGYETGTTTVNVTVHPDYRFVVEPRTTLQGVETELRVTANLPALEVRGEEAVKMGDPVHWYITTPSGQEIEGEKDTFHESRAGGPSDVATYDFPEAGEYVVRVELPDSGLEWAWAVYAHPPPEIEDGSNETGSSESDSSWVYELDRYQTYSKVKGEIVQVDLINVTVIDENEIEAMLRVRNTRPARYNLETYDCHPLMKDFYNRTLTLDEEECITIPVRAVKRDDSYVAGLDVNDDFAFYFLEHLIGTVACTPSTETLVEIKESIKEENYPDKTMREISLEGWALSTTEFFQDHPETLIKAAAECGTDLAVGEILEELPLISQLMIIVDGMRMTLDGLTCPSEETISIQFRRDQENLRDRVEFPLRNWYDDEEVFGSVAMVLSGPAEIQTNEAVYYTLDLEPYGDKGFIRIPSKILVAYNDTSGLSPTAPEVELYGNDGWYNPFEEDVDGDLAEAMVKDLVGTLPVKVQVAGNVLDHLVEELETKDALKPPDEFLDEENFDIVYIPAGDDPEGYTPHPIKSRIKFPLAFRQTGEEEVHIWVSVVIGGVFPSSYATYHHQFKINVV